MNLSTVGKKDSEQLTNYSVTARNYGIHAAVSMYAIREHGRHDLSNKSAKCCACPSCTDTARSYLKGFLPLQEKLKKQSQFYSPMRKTGMKAPHGTGMVVATADIQN